MARAIIPQNNGDLNQLFFTSLVKIWWSYFKRLMPYRTDKVMIDGHTQTHTGNDNTPRPKLALGKNELTVNITWLVAGYAYQDYEPIISPIFPILIDIIMMEKSLAGWVPSFFSSIMWNWMDSVSIEWWSTEWWEIPGETILHYGDSTQHKQHHHH